MDDISNYTLTHISKNADIICYNKTLTQKTGLWRAENSLVWSLPLLTLQLLTIILLSRALAYLLKPLRQPRVVAYILAGLVLSPSLLGSMPIIHSFVVPIYSLTILETVANLAVVYYMFLFGLEFDIKPLKRAGNRALSIALPGIVFAMVVGWGLHTFVLFKDYSAERRKGFSKQVVFGPVFWGIALSATNFADLARILAERKLLSSSIGQLALSAALISDLVSWLLFIVGMAVVEGKWHTLLLTTAFIVLSVFAVRPALAWAIRNSTNKDDIHNNGQMCFILFGIVFCGLITEACGSNSIVGPFVLGAIMPKGIEFKTMFVERVGNFVTTLLMPLFYLVIGLRFNTGTWLSETAGSSTPRMIGVVIMASAAKIVATFVAAMINKMTPRDSIVLGFLMNTKGLMALIILSSARDLKALDNQTYAVMLVAVWAMTIPVGPFLALTHSSTKISEQYKHRSIRSVGLETELRILACTHTASNASGIIDLIEASNPSRKSPIHVIAVQLVELTDHSAAMLIVHDACKMVAANGSAEEESEFTNNAFENYARQRENVSVQALTAVSAYATIYEDICNLAEEKHANLIVIPFRKQAMIDVATDESDDPLLQDINKNVIENAKCSVGVFVDCGLTTSRITDSSVACHNFAVFFIGGPDDREALAYGWRMAGHPRVNLTVVRFIPSAEAWKVSSDHDDNSESEAMLYARWQKQLDEAYMDEFKLEIMNEPSIKLREELVNNWSDILNLISTMEGQFELCIVGRGNGNCSPISAPTFECSNTEELGALGDSLVSARLMKHTSLLIMQQGSSVDELYVEETMGQVGEHDGHTTWQAPVRDHKDPLLQTL